MLMAGGRSSRYGSDKALAMVDGRPLWQRQIAVLRELQPAALYISGRGYDGTVEVLPDAEPGRGAFSGLVAALRRCEQDYLVVLAVDLPRMSAGYLARLLRMERGVVPIRGRLCEPLAAVYSKAVLPAAEKWLREDDASFQGFLRKMVAEGLIEEVLVCSSERLLFSNMNTPDATSPEVIQGCAGATL